MPVHVKIIPRNYFHHFPLVFSEGKNFKSYKTHASKIKESRRSVSAKLKQQQKEEMTAEVKWLKLGNLLEFYEETQSPPQPYAEESLGPQMRRGMEQCESSGYVFAGKESGPCTPMFTCSNDSSSGPRGLLFILEWHRWVAPCRGLSLERQVPLGGSVCLLWGLKLRSPVTFHPARSSENPHARKPFNSLNICKLPWGFFTKLLEFSVTHETP